MYKCINCDYEGDKLSVKPLIGKCPTCGDEVVGEGKSEPKPKPKKKVGMDLNGDGVFDKKDVSLAGRVLGKSRKKKKGGKK